MIFDITKTVVVEDFETLVAGVVDHIDSKTYKIERRHMDVPINHTDGCGMILPRVHKKAFMFRLPWVKGLLVPFAFDEFCREYGCNGDIIDIYGRNYNIFDDDVEIILTKSQFKMNKYYPSWQDYVNKYIENNCQAGMCNEEEECFRNAKFNYQMLQTLSDMTDSELQTISKKARDDIVNIASDRGTMLKVFGATKHNKNKTHLQQALEIYPEMLSDNYCKDILKMIKKKLVKNARAAKFEVEGKYTFIVPDLYAFCERLFLGEDNPVGLLKDGEVYCHLYKNSPELDCLRSPHLYREHAIRQNTIDSKKSRWFITNGLYTSCHDLISKLLQFDVDGDKSLVCADKTIIKVAKRNMQDVVPLYYEMGAAKPVIIDNSKLYEGLTFVFANCNIGVPSNNISKVWNSENINLDVIKLLTAETNFIIDAAKTLVKLKRPPEVNKLIHHHTKMKLPHFFIYAKDKSREQVHETNASVVNRLEALIPNKRLVFDNAAFGEFDYRMLMDNPDVEVDEQVVKVYRKLKADNKFLIHIDDIRHSNISYIYQQNRTQLLEVCSDANRLADILVKYLYFVRNSKQKEALWFAFGDILLNNLRVNLNKKFGKEYIVCEKCKSRVRRSSNRQLFCEHCQKENGRERGRVWVFQKRNSKKVDV